MYSLLRPDISSPLQVTEIEDMGDSKDGDQQAKAILTARVTNEFADKWQDDPIKVFSSIVNHAVAGIDVNPDWERAEFRKSTNSARGIMTIGGIVTKIREGIDTGPLTQHLVPIDSLLGRVILLDQEEEITGEERSKVIKEIIENYEMAKDMLDPEDSTLSLDHIINVLQIRRGGIEIQDIERFLFALKSRKLLRTITTERRKTPPLRYQASKGDSSLFTIKGFAHDTAVGYIGDTNQAEQVGSRIIYPRRDQAVYENRFLMRLKILEEVFLKDLKLPIRFFDTQRRQVHGYTGEEGAETFEKKVESFAKIDLEVITNYPSTSKVLELLDDHLGRRKAIFIKNQNELERILNGDQSKVKHFSPRKRVTAINPLTLAENPDLNPKKVTVEADTYPTLQAVEEAEDHEHGVLFCKFMPTKDILRRLYQHAHKLRAIVFTAPSHKEAASVVTDEDGEKFQHEKHIFFGAEKFMALRELHRKFPDIKIIWAHPGAKRNLIFVDDDPNGEEEPNMPVFTKPEMAEQVTDRENSVRVSFCGSSTPDDQLAPEARTERDEKEKAFVQAYNEYSQGRGKKLVGINGGGPDVMKRNGKFLQDQDALSISTACDLGFAGQTRHDNWDAIINLDHTTTSFALREELLMGGEIVHIEPGGIGSIEEILKILAQNKTGKAEKRMFLVGKKYWEGQIAQFLDAAKAKNIKSEHLKLMFVVDTPEEVAEILQKSDNEEGELDKTGYIKEREDLWQQVIDGEEEVSALHTYQ
jgi:predicted Rossmann-fold nucleotide-binding protein